MGEFCLPPAANCRFLATRPRALRACSACACVGSHYAIAVRPVLFPLLQIVFNAPKYCGATPRLTCLAARVRRVRIMLSLVLWPFLAGPNRQVSWTSRHPLVVKEGGPVRTAREGTAQGNPPKKAQSCGASVTLAAFWNNCMRSGNR